MYSRFSGFFLIGAFAFGSLFLAHCLPNNHEYNSPTSTIPSALQITPASQITPITTKTPIYQFIFGDYECIALFETFAYSLGSYGGQRLITPGSPWILESSLPDNSGQAIIQISRNINGKNEIWINTVDIYVPLLQDVKRIIQIYSVKSKEWQVIPANISDTDFFVEELFVTGDGTVWGGTKWVVIEDFSREHIPVLSVYNEESMVFEFDNDSVSMPLIQGETDYFDHPVIVLDENDVFWIFIQQDGLYSYDTETKLVQFHISLNEYPVEDATIDNKGSIIFSIDTFELGLKDGRLFRFDTKTGVVTPIVTPLETWPYSGSILFDDQDRLWIGAVGWMDKGGEWNMIYPNPNDYFENVFKDSRWATPEIILQSSDGVLWFRRHTLGIKGTAWYEPETGNGCWFSSEYGNVIEDANKNIWFVASGKLYKYNIEN